MQILIVDDDAEHGRSLTGILKRFGHRAEAVISGEEALARLSAAKPGYDIVFVDHVMYTGMDGMELLRRVKNEWPESPIVLFTGQGDVESGVEALRLGAYRYMFKPIVHEELQLIIQAVHEVEGLRREKEWLSILLQISRMTLLSANDMDRASAGHRRSRRADGGLSASGCEFGGSRSRRRARDGGPVDRGSRSVCAIVLTRARVSFIRCRSGFSSASRT